MQVRMKHNEVSLAVAQQHNTQTYIRMKKRLGWAASVHRDEGGHYASKPAQ
jgi:hypothetical protein